ncbi:transposase [Streptomyces sp. NPDC058964]|uniref:transposase n=1 Tax=Streptomyces sp. NPDC058964 TaxID=3346681 RepID=UPI003678415E
MLEPFARADQRRWGQVCPRGLLLVGRRRSVVPMAARLGDDGKSAGPGRGRPRPPSLTAVCARCSPHRAGCHGRRGPRRPSRVCGAARRGPRADGDQLGRMPRPEAKCIRLDAGS